MRVFIRLSDDGLGMHGGRLTGGQRRRERYTRGRGLPACASQARVRAQAARRRVARGAIVAISRLKGSVRIDLDVPTIRAAWNRIVYFSSNCKHGLLTVHHRLGLLLTH